MQSSVLKFEEADLQRLSQDPQNIVCRYTQAERIPKEERLTPHQVWIRAKGVYSAFLKALEQGKHPTEARACVCRSSEEYRSFSLTHPLIFDRLTSSTTTGKDIKMVKTVCDLHSQNRREEWESLVKKEFVVYPTENKS